MDKSESEILEEWDLVSSVYDTEQENDMTEKKISISTETSPNGNTEASINGNTETSTNGNTGTSTNANIENRTGASVKISETDSEETINVDTKKTADADTAKPTERDTEKTVEVDTKDTAEADTMETADSAETVEADTMELVEGDAEETVESNTEEASEVHTEEGAEADTEEGAEADTEEGAEADTEEEAEVDTEEVAEVYIEKTAEADIEKTAEADIEETAEADIEETVEDDTVKAADAEADIEETVEADIEETAEADTEEISEPDTEEITVIETIMYNVKKISDIGTEKATEAAIEKISCADIEAVSYENIEKINNVDTKTSDDTEIKEYGDAGNNIDVDTNYNKETIIEYKTGASNDHSIVDNNDDHVVNSSLDSSMEHIQMEHCEGSSIQDLPELLPSLTEQESAAIESSSSDIDIIDENMEESVTSSFMHPLSLSISSSVDTSSILTSPSEDDKDVKIEDVRQPEKCESYPIKSETYPKTSEIYAEKLESYPKKSESYVEKSESIPRKSDYEYQRYSHERSENVHHPESQRPQPHARCDIFGVILQFFRNMTRLEWSLLGGVVIGLYLTIVFNQTNIFAVIEKEDVVFQMKKMIDELKYDNKLLKDQMLSEMKNEKVFSSFEHQIKELRKENSRLNHMLYDVAKVLEEQKNSHEKIERKEAEYLAPFKKEINKLKEHINILKFDNEELQKQLVRMRYASYSQGGKDMSDDKGKEQKEEIKVDETSSTEEIPLDINSLKKWNELISLLSKELGLLSENDPLVKEKSHSETKKNISWYWKVFLKEFKGTFDEFKANITSKFSDYRKVHENTVSDIYKFVKNFFTVEEQNKQQFIPPGEESSQWKNMGDFFSDLKDKWTKIKNRIDTSDLKNFFKDFKMPGDAATSQEYNSQKSKSSAYEYNERKPTNVHFESERKPTTVHFESERKPTNVHFESDRKQDKVQSSSEDTKWMFERAALRAELRDSEKEDDSVNWFLKKNKHLKKDNTEKNKF